MEIVLIRGNRVERIMITCGATTPFRAYFTCIGKFSPIVLHVITKYRTSFSYLEIAYFVLNQLQYLLGMTHSLLVQDQGLLDYAISDLRKWFFYFLSEERVWGTTCGVWQSLEELLPAQLKWSTRPVSFFPHSAYIMILLHVWLIFLICGGFYRDMVFIIQWL